MGHSYACCLEAVAEVSIFSFSKLCETCTCQIPECVATGQLAQCIDIFFLRNPFFGPNEVLVLKGVPLP